MAFDRRRALAHEQLPVRCSISADCCSSVLTSTKRMVGRVTTSQIAAASAASFLLRLYVRLHIPGRHQPDSMPELRDLPRPGPLWRFPNSNRNLAPRCRWREPSTASIADFDTPSGMDGVDDNTRGRS